MRNFKKTSLKRISLRRVISLHALAICALSGSAATTAYAQQIPLTNGVSVTQTAHGVPVVNIAAPDAYGVSHNVFSQFDVNAQGVVLNNSYYSSNSVIGGYTRYNANMQAKSASLIINEVKSSAPSHLRGPVEVFGRNASVVLANPNGSYCDGCAFTNASRVSLAAAKPEYMAGKLGFDATGHAYVYVHGNGINAQSVDYFDIIGGAVSLNAQVNAKDLTISSGNHKFDYHSKVATGTGGSYGALYAIDSTRLGGMSGTNIRLLANGTDFGVNLIGAVKASGSFSVQSSGFTTLGNVSAAKVNATATVGTITANKIINTTGDVTFLAPVISLQGSIVSSGNIDIRSTNGNLTLADYAYISSGGYTYLDSQTDLNINGTMRSLEGDFYLHAARDVTFGSKSTVEANYNLTANVGGNVRTLAGSKLVGGTVALDGMKVYHGGDIRGYHAAHLFSNRPGRPVTNLGYTENNADIYVTGSVSVRNGMVSLQSFGNIVTGIDSQIASKSLYLNGMGIALAGDIFVELSAKIDENTFNTAKSSWIEVSRPIGIGTGLSIFSNSVNLKGIINAPTYKIGNQYYKGDLH